MPAVLSVNIAHPRPNDWDRSLQLTGIDKRPTAEAVHVRAPGPQREGGLGSGLVGDAIGDLTVHGGDDQAVYAYAREDLDRWVAELGRPLRDGAFGENLTLTGVDVTNARVGERWAIGDTLVLEVTEPRVPCSTFRAWIDEGGAPRRVSGKVELRRGGRRSDTLGQEPLGLLPVDNRCTHGGGAV